MSGYENYTLFPVPWIKQMPEHWGLVRGKNLYQKMQRPTSDTDEVVTCFRDGTVTLRKNRRTTGFTESLKEIGYQGIRKGDLVIHVMDAFAGSIGVSDSDGKGTPVYSVCQAKGNSNNQYYALLLREMARSGYIQSLYRGIRERSSDFRFEVFAAQFYPVPPREEQDQIVRFLDWKVSGINKLIAVKQKQIATLKEFMQAEIEKQLCAYPVVSVVRLKQLGTFFKGGGFSRDNLVEDEEYPAILYGDIYTQYEYKTSIITHHIDGTAYSASRKILKGDIVMAGTGETKDEIGKSILYMGDQIVAAGGDVIVFHPNGGINVEYLLYQLYSQAALKHRYINGKGDIIVHIYPTALGNTIITLPGEADQNKVVAIINEIIDQVKKAIAVLTDEISVLREYRVRLVADTVTGKIDVRGIEIPEYEFVDEDTDTGNEDGSEEETEEQED